MCGPTGRRCGSGGPGQAGGDGLEQGRALRGEDRLGVELQPDRGPRPVPGRHDDASAWVLICRGSPGKADKCFRKCARAQGVVAGHVQRTAVEEREGLVRASRLSDLETVGAAVDRADRGDPPATGLDQGLEARQMPSVGIASSRAVAMSSMRQPDVAG